MSEELVSVGWILYNHETNTKGRTGYRFNVRGTKVYKSQGICRQYERNGCIATEVFIKKVNNEPSESGGPDSAN